MVRTVHIMMAILAFVIVLGSMPQGVVADNQGAGSVLSRPYQLYQRDEFTYRFSFRLTDGTELFIIRGRFTTLYYLHTAFPPAKEHHMMASVGFYYGKTMLGRPVISDVSFQELSFYPKWRDSVGIEHDLVMDIPVFTLNDSVFDGQRTGGIILLETDAVIGYLPEFGGTFVFIDMIFTFDDGTEIRMSDNPIQVVLEKNYNRLHPDNATVYGIDGSSYSSDSDMAVLSTQGLAPLVVLLDLIIAYSLIGLTGLTTLLIALHIKGKITLSFGWLRRITSTPTQST
ncbi:MAG: hypothetical protein JSW61_08755 [Candidatus Thorarchaeota archaeon]|nr:MAG: hypothetical protein JSW61_08755 [Candidatus Thorarchaeota archaeon]